MTFQYLTVLCIPAIGHVYDISVPDIFMYTCYRSCIYDISIPIVGMGGIITGRLVALW